MGPSSEEPVDYTDIAGTSKKVDDTTGSGRKITPDGIRQAYVNSEASSVEDDVSKKVKVKITSMEYQLEQKN
jgi:hypothetical protein